MNPSYQLISQHFTHYLIDKALCYLDRSHYNYRYQDLKTELWFNGLWTNLSGIISYRDYAEFLLLYTQAKSYQLPYQQVGHNIYIVQGKLEKYYTVTPYSCNCPLFQLRKKRSQELPQFFKHFPITCHHHQLIKSL
ncbi:hypothetical protein [Cyanobacterium sp. Dongsha4]|uniref:hypothetical protein n=1 Tax=Cyanobacterium sp. DS4 TaxID=2878255 RepID=UPI002E823201|nr:hypothetical protein [Cyanobacterium sp. Dongsha4]WVL00469.1 hypothetical protein Dongsha4_17755 [Cyanobacterium sp. Dongsha4]